MRFPVLRISTIGLLIALCPCLFSCQKPKEAKAVVTKQEFAVSKVSEHGFEVKAKGEIQNIGEADLKNIKVTGHCPSCGQSLIFGTWYISDIPKTEAEQDIISYLPVGGKAEFSFSGVAMFMSNNKEPPQTMPEKLEIEIISFEPAT